MSLLSAVMAQIIRAVAPPAGGAWTPAEISTALWLDAADAATITESGGAVSQWNDKSGNSWNATQATGSRQPLLVANELNGKAVLRFNEDFLTAGSFNVSQPLSVFAVAKTDKSGSFRHYLFDGVSGRNLMALNGASTTNGTLSIWASTWLQGPANDTNWNLVGAQYNGGSSLIWRNAAQVASGNAGANNMTGGVRIGTNNNATQDWLYGDLAEIVFISGVVSEENRQRIEGYLAHKWGLEGELPAGHPYKAAPPTINTPYSDVILADGPKAYYRMGESSGTTLVDEVDSPTQDGSVFGTLTLGVDGAIAGDSDTAIQDTTTSGSNYAHFPITLGFGTNDGLAIEAWVKWTTGVMIRDATNTAGTFMLLESGSFVFCRVGGADVVTTIPIADLQDGAFHHVVMEYVHSTTTVNIYVDGALAYSTTISARSGSTTSSFRGFRNGSASSAHGQGVLDEVAFYDKPLGAAVVASHHAAGT